MDKATLTALQASIQKWKEIEAGTGVDEGTKNCALCKRFYYDTCKGCPVTAATGQPGCFKSPYTLWAQEQARMPPADTVEGYKATTHYLVLLARQEREFLESLLPDNVR